METGLRLSTYGMLQASVTIEAMPEAHIGDLETFATHRLHGIPEDGLYMSDFS